MGACRELDTVLQLDVEAIASGHALIELSHSHASTTGSNDGRCEGSRPRFGFPQWARCRDDFDEGQQTIHCHLVLGRLWNLGSSSCSCTSVHAEPRQLETVTWIASAPWTSERAKSLCARYELLV